MGVAAPSVIHGLHRQWHWAAASPFMRAGLAMLDAYIGASAESCEPGEMFCGLGGLVVGGGLGRLTAMVVDYSVALAPVAGEPRSEIGRLATQPRPPVVSLHSAGIAPTRNGASVVLGGSF